jgi:DNA-binding response OmpR family regulator
MDSTESIIKILEGNNQGLSTSELSQITGHTRATIAKYLEMLKIQNKVQLREVGRTKLWIPNTKKSTILIAEDEPHIRKLIRIVLKEENYNFVEASDGLIALEKVNEHMPDLIILDLMMPRVDGIKVCSQLKKNALTRNIPILMLTAKKEMGDRIIGVNVGADDYLVKPFEPRELRSRVTTFIDSKKSDRNLITNLPNYNSVKKAVLKCDKETNISLLFFENLDTYQEAYGQTKSNELIRLTSQLITHRLEKDPNLYFLGHDTSNNFIICLKNLEANKILKEVTKEFELTKPFFYDIDFKHIDKGLKIINKYSIDGKLKELPVVQLKSEPIKNKLNLDEELKQILTKK